MRWNIDPRSVLKFSLKYIDVVFCGMEDVGCNLQFQSDFCDIVTISSAKSMHIEVPILHIEHRAVAQQVILDRLHHNVAHQ